MAVGPRHCWDTVNGGLTNGQQPQSLLLCGRTWSWIRKTREAKISVSTGEQRPRPFPALTSEGGLVSLQSHSVLGALTWPPGAHTCLRPSWWRGRVRSESYTQASTLSSPTGKGTPEMDLLPAVGWSPRFSCAQARAWGPRWISA